MKEIKRDYKKIYEEMLKIDKKKFIVAFLSSIYDVEQLKNDFKNIFLIEINSKNYIRVITEVVNIIFFKEEGWEKILNKAIYYNKVYIESFGYHKLPEEQIIEVFKQGMIPAIHHIGASPDMLVMYYFGGNIFQGEKLEFYKKWYKEFFGQIEHKEISDLKADMSKNFDDFELEVFLDENNIDVNNVNIMDKIAKKFDCKYDKENKTYSDIKQSILLMLYSKVEKFEEFKKSTFTWVEVIDSLINKIDFFAIQEERLVKELFTLREENKNLKSKIKNISKEYKDMDKTIQILKNETQLDKDKQILELNKKNNFLQVRIEKLENQISLLEESKRINETIQENIEIKEKVIDVIKQPFDFQEICILGGNWNSIEKEKLQKVLPTCDIEFIEAERTLAKIDRIANADIIIFDTSRNAHAYYYKVKQFAKKVLHINKSKSEAVKELVMNNDLQNSF